MAYLTEHPFYEEGELQTGVDENATITLQDAEQIYNLVGGRIQNLVTCKRKALLGVPVSQIAEKFKEKELEKFTHLHRSKNTEKALKMILEIESNKKCKEDGVLMSKLIGETSESTVKHLSKFNIVKYNRTYMGVFVNFESKLTSSVVKELVW